MSIQVIDKVKNQLHRAAFLVAQPGKAEEAHSEILRCILDLEQLNQENEEVSDQPPKLKILKHTRQRSSTDEREEISKVERRLRLWSRRPSQINTQILIAFLKANREGVKHVTESDIRSRVPDPSSFDINFAQMKIIAPKNHGKIFEHDGQEVTIWDPVKPFVTQFEKTVFQNK